ncbi:alpha/beta-hydrolase [Zalerion maritima]|uniref:Alpha/beta-hydrolase n=1 Tax=Zalerion maritima TaxID=339359 RepID=A0AAD5RML2_9PEZI|nr:alpha/beta-hydrolase [Zalerion maritima]
MSVQVPAARNGIDLRDMHTGIVMNGRHRLQFTKIDVPVQEDLTMRMSLPAALLGTTPALAGASAIQNRQSNDTTPTVTLDYSTVVAAAGNTTAGFWKFQNIRFAQAPTGDLRFAPPEWPLTEDSDNTGDLAGSDVDCSSEEDCLFMDIWVPQSALDGTADALPVAVWTYGGGFTGGSKSQNTPEGLFDLSTDFIFVSYNYRLGITGLANGPSFNHQGGTSNVALWDVSQAFSWVQRYIGEFGGNPDQVTAMGFSAGGSHILFQMTRFGGRAEQLFSQAYVMSPGLVPSAGHETAEQFWLNASSAAGCDGGDLGCMKSLDFDTVHAAGSDVAGAYDYSLQPKVDGYIISDTYEACFYAKHFNFSGPVVLTHELHEANSQEYSGVDTDDDVGAALRDFFPLIQDRVVEEALELYPADDYASPGFRFSDIKQHFELTAHNLAATHGLNNQTWNALVELGSATHGTDQIYSTYTLSSSASSDSEVDTDATGTTAASSAAASTTAGLGGNSTDGGGIGGSASVDSGIAIMMQKYLISFIQTGDPNTLWADDKLYWPMYNESDNGVEIYFNTTFTTGHDDLANDQALFWNKALWY